MEFNETEIMTAYKIYSRLVGSGSLETAEAKEYIRDERIEELVDHFASSDDAAIITAGDTIYIVPIAITSSFHMNNETIKKLYLNNSATNLDIYLMYVAIIVFLGEFYNSYQTQEPTRNFIHMEEWLQAMNTRIEGLSQIDEETLKNIERQHEYNWVKIVEKWMAIDDLKENIDKSPKSYWANTSSNSIVKSLIDRSDDETKCEIEAIEGIASPLKPKV